MDTKRVIGIVCLLFAAVLFLNGIMVIKNGPPLFDKEGAGYGYAVGALFPAIVSLIVGVWLFGGSPAEQSERPNAIAEETTLGPGHNLYCKSCCGVDLEMVVQYGSYSLRCKKCKAGIVCTSWISIGPRMNTAIQVFRDGDESAPIMEGIGSSLAGRIGHVANDGTTLILRPIPESQ